MEPCSAKNVIAIAAGIGDGLGYGDTAKAALITRALAEIWRLVERHGGTLGTGAGLAGVGDVIATCTSAHSRNRWAGEQIGLGPKAAARVLRLQRARRLLASGRGQAETAAMCGFYDQAHLSGEFKAMTGCTPRGCWRCGRRWRRWAR